jgi:hypothetical protein
MRPRMLGAEVPTCGPGSGILGAACASGVRAGGPGMRGAPPGMGMPPGMVIARAGALGMACLCSGCRLGADAGTDGVRPFVEAAGVARADGALAMLQDFFAM